MGPLPQRKHCLIMLQVLFLASLASAAPAPEADPLLYTGHPLTYSVPYVTYHAPTCETEFEEVKGQSCVTKPVTECNEVEVPSHKIVTEDVCQNVTTAECTHSTVTTLPAPAGVYTARGRPRPTPKFSLEPSLQPMSPPTTTASTRLPRCATQSRRLSQPPSPSSLAC